MLSLVLWQQLLIIAGAIVAVVLFWTIILANILYPWWWSMTIYYYIRIEHRIRYGRYLARMNKGLCPHCAYNLRGNTTGTCPECGHDVEFIPPRILPSEANRTKNWRRFRAR